MTKEQIKKVWEDHKEEIIGGALILASLVIIGVSVSSAVKVSKQQHKEIMDAKKGYDNFCKEMVALGAEMKPGNPYPVATKKVAEKVLNEGEVFLLNGTDKGMKIIYVFDSKAADDTGLRNFV